MYADSSLPVFLVGVNYNPETRNVDAPMFEAVVPDNFCTNCGANV